MIPAVQLIDSRLLHDVAAAAAASPRGRKNHNFHASAEEPCNRLLNGMEPGTYIAPHRHLEPTKSETVLVLRGRLGVVFFDDSGGVTGRFELAPASERVGVDIPAGTWHTFVALAAGTVMFEAKAGPYRPLADGEFAPWAPREGDAAAADYGRQLSALFG